MLLTTNLKIFMARHWHKESNPGLVHLLLGYRIKGMFPRRFWDTLDQQLTQQVSFVEVTLHEKLSQLCTKYEKKMFKPVLTEHFWSYFVYSHAGWRTFVWVVEENQINHEQIWNNPLPYAAGIAVRRKKSPRSWTEAADCLKINGTTTMMSPRNQDATKCSIECCKNH